MQTTTAEVNKLLKQYGLETISNFKALLKSPDIKPARKAKPVKVKQVKEVMNANIAKKKAQAPPVSRLKQVFSLGKEKKAKTTVQSKTVKDTINDFFGD